MASDSKATPLSPELKKLTNQTAKALAPYDRELQKAVARLLCVHARMIQAIISPTQEA